MAPKDQFLHKISSVKSPYLFPISFQSLSSVVIATMGIILVTSVSGMSMVVPNPVDSQVLNGEDNYKQFYKIS